jgi:hypothetical protein
MKPGRDVKGGGMESKVISIQDANRMLPLLRQIVTDIMVNWEQIIQKRTELECLEKESRPAVAASSGRGTEIDRAEAAQDLKSGLNHLIDKINCYIREVEELGCFVEEFKRGIINFPSLFHGRKVFLCWKPDEGEVMHWHELDETFKDRVRIRDEAEFLCQKP